MKAKGKNSPTFKMPGAPITNWIVLIFLAIVIVMIGIDKDARVALYVAPFWFGLLIIGYFFTRNQNQKNSSINHEKID
jgi:L-asparagine transporter-like permease